MRSCPRCGSQPEVDRCEPWPRSLGPAPWYVGCYRSGSNEHFVGVNGDTQADAIAEWDREALRVSLEPMRAERAALPGDGTRHNE